MRFIKKIQTKKKLMLLNSCYILFDYHYEKINVKYSNIIKHRGRLSKKSIIVIVNFNIFFEFQYLFFNNEKKCHFSWPV